MQLDSVIFGGGAAGLWLLDRLSRDGHHVVLLEARALGSGETMTSQGIIHGGMKGLLSGGAGGLGLRHMPGVWRHALLGRTTPNLTRTRLRSECCYLWQTDSLGSRAGMLSTQLRLHVKSETVERDDRPDALSDVFGTVVRLPEQVICPASLVCDLAGQYRDRILKIDSERGLRFQLGSPGEVETLELTSPGTSDRLKLRPRQVIFSAGAGNARLRELVGLSGDVIRKSSLHVVLARGDLPQLHGHCVDQNRARFTITSDSDQEGRTVYQIGGQIAEDGAKLDPLPLVERARGELLAVLPRLKWSGVEWSTYRVERIDPDVDAESRTDAVRVLCAGNVTTGWPTKLVLAPVLAQEIASRAISPYISSPFDTTSLAKWPRPSIACLPWEEQDRIWWTMPDVATSRRRAA